MKIAATLGLVCIGLVGALGQTFAKRPLPIDNAGVTPLPVAPSVEGLSLSLVPTGSVETQHGLSVRGASLSAPITSAMVAFAVEHPKGLVLIDAGLGRNAVRHTETTPTLMQLLIDLNISQGIAEALGDRVDDVAAVLLTHTHWDHVSGLEDLPDVPVWATAEERAFAAHDDGGMLFRQIDSTHPIDMHDLVLADTPYGPFAKSLDFFDDGSVIIVGLAGHTPGSVGIFVNLPSGERFLFIGDTAWTKEGVDWPAEKPWLTRRLVDNDAAMVREQLILLNRLQASTPDLLIVPAHDARVHEAIPVYPDRTR